MFIYIHILEYNKAIKTYEQILHASRLIKFKNYAEYKKRLQKHIPFI